MANKKSKKKQYIILGIVAAVIIAIVILISNATSKMNEMMQQSSYEVVAASETDMQLEIRGSGAVQPATKSDVYAPVSLQIGEVFVENGSTVQAGEKIATVDAAMIEDQISTLEDSISQADDSLAALRMTSGGSTVKAPIAGTVKVINAAEGDSVEAVMNVSHALIVLSADDSMRVTVEADDLNAYSEGDAVSMTIDEEEVTSVIGNIDTMAGTIEFVIDDEDYDVGQQVDVYGVNGQIIGSGTMAINVPIYVSGSVGIVEDIHVDVNDEVNSNNKLITLEDSVLSDDVLALSEQKEDLIDDLNTLYADLEAAGIGEGYTIYARQDGIVSNVMISDNATVNADTLMFTLQAMQPLELEIAIDELEIAQIEIGQTAQVTFEALPGQKYAAQVTYINPIGQSVNNVTSYFVTVTLQETQDILIGMSGTADIQSQLKTSIVTIPLEAVQIIDDEYYVILGQDAATKTVADHKITVGVSDGTSIEVIEGLEAGDTVTVPNENQNEAVAGMGFGGGMQGKTMQSME